jgi:hypothetical protein
VVAGGSVEMSITFEGRAYLQFWLIVVDILRGEMNVIAVRHGSEYWFERTNGSEIVRMLYYNEFGVD